MTEPPSGDGSVEFGKPATSGQEPDYDTPAGYAPGDGPPPGYAPGDGPPPGYTPGDGPPRGYAPGYVPPTGYGPPQYAYQPSQYGYSPAGPPQDKPSSNIGWAVAALLLFWPLSIPAFIFSGKVDRAWNVGDRAGAEDASRSAKRYGLIGVVVGAVLSILVIIWIIAVFAFVADTVHHIPTFTVTPVRT